MSLDCSFTDSGWTTEISQKDPSRNAKSQIQIVFSLIRLNNYAQGTDRHFQAKQRPAQQEEKHDAGVDQALQTVDVPGLRVLIKRVAVKALHAKDVGGHPATTAQQQQLSNRS